MPSVVDGGRIPVGRSDANSTAAVGQATAPEPEYAAEPE
ncbi:hypothetical protein SAMN04489751_2633 [Brevibacterium sandarakinum]|uniref:Uncharacterized protein n=1 Tax=Brevibacterium sandarakinum TaxID=629680 RepID=A0A1H1UCD7_BRESA|nr:hypothetical protein SAMN04489751_2633 [Brevibacterium sandarakinum]